LIPAVIGDRFRGPQFGSIFGTLQVANAFGGSLGPAGRIFDATGTYRMALVAAAGSAALALVAMWILRRISPAGGHARA
jgi:hypothetical protein